MTYLLDANLSPRIAPILNDAGFETSHVADHGLLTATDDEIFDYAIAHGLIVVTADSDFAMLLATRRTTAPSVVLLRAVANERPDAHARLLTANLSGVEADLAKGAIVSLSSTRLRIRELPLG